ncbi:hypothetical protein EJB05_34672, partial [Eragrostis curvula]
MVIYFIGSNVCVFLLWLILFRPYSVHPRVDSAALAAFDLTPGTGIGLRYDLALNLTFFTDKSPLNETFLKDQFDYGISFDHLTAGLYYTTTASRSGPPTTRSRASTSCRSSSTRFSRSYRARPATTHTWKVTFELARSIAMDANIGDPRLAPSVERAFDVRPLPGFWRQVTPRAMLVSAVLGALFCFIALRIYMTAGLVPSFNMPATVLSFFFLKWTVKLINSCGMATLPFTRQENIFVLTVVNTCIQMTLTGGFANCIIAMSTSVAQTLVDHPSKTDIVDNVDIGKHMIFLFLNGLAGVLVTVPFKQIMLIDYKLLFPSGTVQAELINSFHTPEGTYVAKLQVATLLKTSIGSFSWSIFQWFYSAGNNCGFEAFPTFGLKLFVQNFYFDFSAIYVGLGMICPYTVFIGITMILTDGIFNFLAVIATSLIDFYKKNKEQDSRMIHDISKHPSLTYDDRKRIQQFLSNQIPHLLPVVGYVLCAMISTVLIPSIFDQIKFYHVAAIYIVAPVFSFCNTYGTGLTDWSLAPTYSKFTIFVIAAWIGQPGAVVGSLVACGIMMPVVQISSQVMLDLKTAYMTLTSPQVMITGQIFGVILGSIINPCIFYAFKETVKDGIQIGATQSEYPCPAAGLYRAIGIIGMGGVKELPKHCVAFCTVALFITVAVDSLTLVSQKKGWTILKYAPSMAAIAIPFFYGPSFTITMCLGSTLLYVWNKNNSQSAELLSSVVAAGLIGGGGLFALPKAVLSMNKVEPPMCMKFLPTGQELDEAHSFLSNLSSAKS